MTRELNEKCAVFGVYGDGLEAARLSFFGLYALQHRGQESSGIVTSDGKHIHARKRMGLVSQVFKEKDIAELVGHMAIGHNRYSTSRGSQISHAQPVIVDDVGLALAHNGNIPVTKKLEEYLERKGIAHRSRTDSEMVAEAIAAEMRDGKSLPDATRTIYPLMTGAFSILLLDKTCIVAIRDSYGIRPLSLGRLNGGFLFSSETCAFHSIGATPMRDVAPGEMVVVDADGVRSEQLAESHQKLDIFEFVYFSRPDSELLGKSVYAVRKNFGAQLAREFPFPDADIVIPVPETAVPVALGYAHATGTPLEMALVKNRYIHRTFIEPEQHIREQGVKVKLTPLADAIAGKRVVIIDDSIVRGTTSRQLVRMLFDCGAQKVYFLSSSPPVKFPDFYGIDTPDQGHLIAAHKSVEEIRVFLGATQLGFLSYEGMISATGLPEDSFCTSCFTGRYPIDIGDNAKQVQGMTARLL